MRNLLLISLLVFTYSCTTKKEKSNKTEFLIKLNQDSLNSTIDVDSTKLITNNYREYNYPNRFSISLPTYLEYQRD